MEAEQANPNAVATRIDIGESARFLFQERARFKILFGGRGSLKSWSAARTLLLMGGQQQLRVLCAREYQNSIADSVHRLLADQIVLMGLDDLYTVQKTSIQGINGSEFIFAGLRHNITSLKSLEGIDICWVEEAEAVSEESWQVLEPTIRKPGSEIWVTFNPGQETDPTYQRFVVRKRDDAIVVKVGWKDNPWLPGVLRKQAEDMMRTDPEAYAHVWGGETWRRNDAQVFNGMWAVDGFQPMLGAHDTSRNWLGPYFGADWGFSQDPTVLLKMWIHEKRLYIEHEAYKVGCDIVDTPKLFDTVPGSRKYVIRADCARPETINHVRRAGFHIEAATKWPKSVEDGIALLRSFEKIVIHPRCKNMIQEARLYSYKTDKLTGDVLPEIVDRHNHGWDAARYGLLPLIRPRVRVRRESVYAPWRFI
jgi:phage terminase large subunit